MYLTVFLGGEYGNADVTELYNSKKRKWKIVNRKNGFAKLNGFSAVGFDQNAYVFGGWDINELEVRNGLLEEQVACHVNQPVVKILSSKKVRKMNPDFSWILLDQEMTSSPGIH